MTKTPKMNRVGSFRFPPPQGSSASGFNSINVYLVECVLPLFPAKSKVVDVWYVYHPTSIQIGTKVLLELNSALA